MSGAGKDIMTEKWFQLRCLFFGKVMGKKNIKIEVCAPTIGALREKTAVELVAVGMEPTYVQVDRGKVNISEDNEITWVETTMKKVIDGKQFVKEVLISDYYISLL